MYKLLVLAAALICANAGYLGTPLAAPYAASYAAPYAATYAAPYATTYGAAAPLAYSHAVAPAAITSQHSNILRSFGNLGQVSTYSKTIDTPYSSVSKSDVRVSNPGFTTYAATSPYGYAAHAPLAYTAPAATYGYAAHAPLAYSTPGFAKAGLIGTTYSAAPTVAHISFDSPIAHYAW